MNDEEFEEEMKKKDPEIKWVDGIPCIVVPDGTFMPKNKEPRIMVYKFGNLQKLKENNAVPDIIDELNKMFNSGFFGPTRIRLPKEKEDKEDVNKEREREDKDQI